VIHDLIHDPEFWVAVAFVLAIVLVWRKAKAAMGDALDARAAKIRAELEEARRLREEAQAMLGDYQRKQRDALREAEEIIQRAREEAERLGQRASRDLEAAIQRRRQMAEERIQQAEAKAVAEIRGVAVDVAIAATRRILTQRLDGQRGGQLIDEAIQALPGKLH
jgi:F-type H+-transporting ATPase subunit b